MFDIPQHLVLALAAALSGPVTASAPVPAPVAAFRAEAPAILASLAHSASTDDNPYRLAAQPLFDGLAGLKRDPRFVRHASRVFKTSAGEAYVPVASEAEEMLALRRVGVIARHITESYARANALALAEALGRRPGLADLYLAHRVGLRLAVELRRWESREPGALAVTALPDLDDVAPELVFAGERPLRLADISALVDQAVMLSAHAAGIDMKAPARLRPDQRASLHAATDASRSSPPAATRVMGWQAEVRRASGASARARASVRLRTGTARK